VLVALAANAERLRGGGRLLRPGRILQRRGDRAAVRSGAASGQGPQGAVDPATIAQAVVGSSGHMTDALRGRWEIARRPCHNRVVRRGDWGAVGGATG
jgi:hypothetical protein